MYSWVVLKRKLENYVAQCELETLYSGYGGMEAFMNTLMNLWVP